MRNIYLAAIFLFLLLFAKLVEKNILFTRFDERHAERIQKIFTKKEQTLLHCIDILEQCYRITNCDSCFVAFHGKYADKLKKQGLYLFIYKNDKLDYWTTKDVAVPETYSRSEFDKPYVSLYTSGKYASFVKKGDDYEIVGLALIKHVYNYENKYLKTSFQKDFNLPANVKIFSAHLDNSYPINDNTGKFVWSLTFDGKCFYKYQIYVPALAYLLAIIVIMLLLDSVFYKLHTSKLKNIYIAVLAFILIAVRLAMQYLHIPDVFYRLDIFNPLYFGSNWFPSLGELCLWCIFICFIVLEMYRFFIFPLSYRYKWQFFIYLTVLLITANVGFFAISAIFKELVINSSGIFEGEPKFALFFNGFGMLGYTIIMLFLLSFCLILDKIVIFSKRELTFYQFIILYIIVLSAVIIGWIGSGMQISMITVFFLSVLAIFGGYIRISKNIKFKYPHFVLLVFILALFSYMYINQYGYEKNVSKKKLLVTNLASQHDLTAEFLLQNISERIISDTVALVDYVYNDFPIGNNYPNVLNYIKKQ